MLCCVVQVCRQEGAHPPPPPRSQKGPPDGIVKRFKMIQNNVVMVEMTVSMHFQQLKNLKFQTSSGRACPRPPKSLVFSELARPIIPTLTIWPWFLRYALIPPPPSPPPPHGKFWLRAWLYCMIYAHSLADLEFPRSAVSRSMSV